MKLILKYITLLLTICFFNQLGTAQIQTNELPPSFFTQSNSKASLKSISDKAIINIAKPHLSELRKEDKIEDQYKDIPWRFGKVIDVNWNLFSYGEWSVQSNGSLLWKFNIKAQDAISINLNFNQFHLSKDAKLFVYNSDYSDVLGALTYQNNKSDGKFAIRPIRGSEITLELIVPQSQKMDNQISINQLVYGYRSIFEKSAKTFGSSGNCNVNVNCPQANAWQDIKRSVVMILRANNSRWCSGALINNVEQDSIPYVLTAEHCGLQTNSVFVFNYESSQCSPSVDGNLNNSISGATLRAQHPNSDFTLFELSSKPPASYNVYYAGWSARDVASQQSTVIHHPRGDVKKISFDYDSVTTGSYPFSPVANHHWKVSNWEVGTTEIGSSGSPLFDQNQRIVGQLHGGDAACGNSLEDYFGKFAISWDTYPGSSNQLKPWLDPQNTGILEIDGFDPNPAAFVKDIELVNLYGYPNYGCDTNLTGKFVLKNKGSDTIDYISIDVNLNNNQVQTINWSGKLGRNQLLNLQIPAFNFVSGNNQISLAVDSIFPGVDQNVKNNTTSINTYVNKNPVIVNFQLMTDDYGSETNWEIESNNSSSDNITLYQGGPYDDVNGGQLFNRNLCLYDSCFIVNLFDSFGDGFDGQFGNGYLLIKDAVGDTLSFIDHFTSFSTSDTFCISNQIVNTRKTFDKVLKVYPNPIEAGGTLTFEAKIKNYEIELVDVRGRRITSYTPINNNTINIPRKVKAGIYFLRFIPSDGKSNSLIKKLMIR